MNDEPQTKEHARLREVLDGVPWRRWGPYLSERQWGTVREDYSEDGNAWEYFPHEHARSRAYKWGEDGIFGISDEKQQMCFAIALWNGNDPFLKERLFGLTNPQGNHGEDVKEYYFYLDSTPTHSYMRMLYKYPHAAFPYEDLVKENGARGGDKPEYELIDTGIFDDNRYHDVYVEYAKEGPDEILVRVTATNRGPEAATLHVLPHLWFRNTWWNAPDRRKPSLRASEGSEGAVVEAQHPALGDYHLYCEGAPELLFTENESNDQLLFGRANASAHVKDAINDFVVHGRRDAVNPAREGTKAAARYTFDLAPGESKSVHLRLRPADAGSGTPFGEGFEATFAKRMAEADEFYAALTPAGISADSATIMRQGYAGLLIGKQTFIYDVEPWLDAQPSSPTPGQVSSVRNSNWFHMDCTDVISMPDKWEYPWFAAWDLAFHAVALASVDPEFAWDQLSLMLSEHYLHPNGQIPAYEWNFSDVNPPVHSWGTLFTYYSSRDLLGPRAREELRVAFQKLLLNFTWWVNRKDRDGRNVFQGGFLGLDNIGVFDRSAELPTGGYFDQADGTAWMALFAQNMLQIAIELALEDPMYEEIAVKFYEHFVWIASSMDRVGDNEDEMWDETDGFFYDVLRLPDGTATRLKVRSLVGLLPLCAVTVYPEEILTKLPKFVERARAFNEKRPHLIANINPPGRPGVEGRRLLSILNESQLRRVLAYMLDEEEFLSNYGIRSISRYHRDHPYVFRSGGEEYSVSYLPGVSNNRMFGGNSNWRGPIWMPVNVLIIRALLHMHSFFGDDFKVECPTGSGQQMTLFEVSREIARRLESIFARNETGKRPVFAGIEEFNGDPHWRDHIPFYEYFHGDTGAGVGASHQTGWTGAIAALIQYFGTATPETALQGRV
jgi:hypothetical protein